MNTLYDLTFFDLYEKNARIHRESCAIQYKDREISFSALYEQTRDLAAGLARLNLKPGARIAVLSCNHPAFFHLFGAASALNLCLVLINRRLSLEEMTHVIQDTTPQVIVADPEMADRARELTGNHDCLDRSLIIDDDLNAFYIQEEFTLPQKSVARRPYIIIHTAAVQGKPRGAVLSQENIILANLQIIHTFGLDTAKAYLNILPLFHIMGVNLGLATLMAGGKNVIVEKFSPQETLNLIQDTKITIFGSFPPILSTLIDAMDKGDWDLSSLEITAGLEMPDTVKAWEAATGATFWTMYGQTETSGLISFAQYFKRPGSAGVISPLATVKIADDMDTLLPPDQVGEILVKGPLVFQGYWNADDLNAFTFRDGWHHTGDLGLVDADGFLFFKGRKAEKELIKPGGENVFPAEVEKAIASHEAVDAVCVFGVPDPKFGEGIKAVITLHPGKQLTQEGLTDHLSPLIAGYKKPRYVEFVATLPRAADNTLDRAKIKAEFS